jgi:hypothetical protein
MGNLTLNGATSGQVTVSPPAVAGTNTLTFPTGTGTFSVNGLSTNIVTGTINNGGTNPFNSTVSSVTYTGIPSWVKRIIILFNGVSLTGTDQVGIQIGSGSTLTSGYLGTGQNLSTAPASGSLAASTAWFINSSLAANVLYGSAILYSLGNNAWIISGSFNQSSTFSSFLNGSATLSGTLDRVVIAASGSNTFDAGYLNILYE